MMGDGEVTIDAYTIGYEPSYEKALRENPRVAKVGKQEGYGGGIVWKTANNAATFLVAPEWDEIDWGDGKPRDASKFRVYGLELQGDWNSDTYEGRNGQRYLLRDAWIVPCSGNEMT